jgi:hypothetical protein
MYKVNLVKNNICFYQYRFSGWICWPECLNKDFSAWLDGARPANTHTPPSLPGSAMCPFKNIRVQSQNSFVRESANVQGELSEK